MHHVYIIEFYERKARNEQPFLYIGSKSNCTYDGTNLISKKGKIYLGSSTSDLFKEHIKTEPVKVYSLAEFENYEDCIAYERELQRKNDVVASSKYYNLAIAQENRYTDPKFCTMRHVETGKTVRIERDHPMIKSGEYVNANAGYKTYNNGVKEKQFPPGQEIPEGWIKGRLEANILRGENASFYGRTVSEESKDKFRESLRISKEENPERWEAISKNLADSCRSRFSGKPKSAESNLKRARPGMLTLINRTTGEKARVKKEDKHLYDSTVWVSPLKLYNEQNPHLKEIKWYTDEKVNVKIGPGDKIPEGFRPGKKPYNRKAKNEN